MANLLLPSRNTKQPQHSVQIDWSNPVTNGLLAVDLPGLGYGVVNQNQATGNAPVVPGPVGQQYSLTASSSQYSSIPVARSLVDGATHLLVFIPNLSSGNNYQRGSTLSGPTHHRSFLQLFDGGGGAYSSIQLGGCLGSEFNNSYANFSANTQSGVNTLLGYWGQNGAIAGIVHNGKLSTGALNSTGTPFGTSASLDSGRLLYVGSPYYGDFTGIALNAVWDRALSTSELLALNDSPWQIFAPQKRVIYFDVGAGGGSTTYNDSINILYQPGLTNTSSNTITGQLSIASINSVSKIGSLHLTEDSSFTIHNEVIPSSLLVGGSEVDLGLLYTFNDQYFHNIEVNEESIVSGILNTLSTNTANISTLSTIDPILDISETAYNNMTPNLLLSSAYNISSASSIDISGDINVSLTINSSYGILSTTSLIARNDIALSTSVSSSSLDNTSVFSELSIDLSNDFKSNGGYVIDAETLLSFTNDTISSLLLEVSGNLVLSTESSVLNSTALSSDNTLTLSTLLAKEVISNIIANSSISIDYEVTIINKGINPLLKIRINSKEILIRVETKDLLIRAETKDLLVLSNDTNS